ncbi:MAG: cellulase family glycosylhydrolase [Candidatus Sulfotelmatobacter sp.]
MRTVGGIAGHFAAAAALCLIIAAETMAQTSPPTSRLAHLKHGINIGRFLDGTVDNPGISQCANNHDAKSCTYTLAGIKALGVDHVRILLEPGGMLDLGTPGAIDGPSLRVLDSLIGGFVNQHVAVILALSLDEPRFNNKLGKDPQFLESLKTFWTAIASHYARRYSPELLFFEVLNEPGLNEPDLTFEQWSGTGAAGGGIQAALIQAIRAGASQNTILATGAENSDINGLLALSPPAFSFGNDANIVYTFHYYEPFSFTHQGETWNTGSYAYYLSGVRYPYAAEPAAKAAGNVADLKNKMYAWHSMETATKDWIKTDVEIVSEWAARNKVSVICDEFGVERQHEDAKAFAPSHLVGAAAEDRARWVGDVRQLMEQHGIGWTFWDYSSASFGLVPDGDASGKSVGAALKLTVAPDRNK